MAAYHLRTFYLARQTTWGTPVVPNVRLEGVTDGSVTVNIEDDIVETIGWNVGNITMRKERESEIVISLVATYEQILYTLHGLFGAVTPTDTGGSAPYIWTYEVPRANTVTPQLYTFRYGIGTDIYELSNCLLSEMSLKGEVNRALELELTLICPNAPVISTVPTITPTTVNAMHVRESEFYLTLPSFNPILGVPVEATLISFEINVNPNRHIKRFIGNDTYYGEGKWEIDGTFVLEFNPTSKAVFDNALTNPTPRVLNFGVRFISPTNNNNQLSIIMPFFITDSVELFSDRDGNATIELNVKAVYNQLFDTALKIAVQTDTDTLP